jgi:hypothetical protein
MFIVGENDLTELPRTESEQGYYGFFLDFKISSRKIIGTYSDWWHGRNQSGDFHRSQIFTTARQPWRIASGRYAGFLVVDGDPL